MKFSLPIMCMLVMQIISIHPTTAFWPSSSTTPDTNPYGPSNALSLFIEDTRNKYSGFSLNEFLDTVKAKKAQMDQSHAEHVIMLTKTHAEKIQDLEDTSNTILDTKKAFYINDIENLKNNYAAELWSMQNQLDSKEKRNAKLEDDIKTIAENRAKCAKIKQETGAILEGYLVSGERDDWSELWE